MPTDVTEPALHPLALIWPPARLRVVTPRLELRLPTDAEIVDLMEVAAAGVHDPATMPFAQPWTDVPAGEMGRRGYQWHARCRANWSPERWTMLLGVFVDGEPAGAQDLAGAAFGMLRETSSGSWLAQKHQGRGLGTEMRQAMLHLAFEGLGALSAVSSAADDNHASMRVSEKCGYRTDGIEMIVTRRGVAAPGGESAVRRRSVRYRIDHADWHGRRRDDIRIEGLDDDLLELVGVSRDPD